MYEIKIKDNTTSKTFNENYDSYYLFIKRVMKLRHSSKLTMVSHSSLVD